MVLPRRDRRGVISIRPSTRLKTPAQVICVLLTLAIFMSVAMMPLHKTLLQYNLEVSQAAALRGHSGLPANNGAPIVWQGTTPTVEQSKDDAAPQDPSAPPVCTAYQRDTLLNQLPDCKNTKKYPWGGRCSFSWATQCPEAPWLSEYFQKASKKTKRVGVHIGCDQGVAAVDTLRLLSNNPAVHREIYKAEVSKHTEQSLETTLCDTPQPGAVESSKTTAVVHCVAPNAKNAQVVTESAKALEWEDSLVVSNQAVVDCKGDGCTSLDAYLDTAIPTDGVLDYLKIDIEGVDAQILEGGGKTLSRVGYLDFEYHWKGSWPQFTLSSVLRFLEDHKFACYWAGTSGSLWRISHGCFLNHYDYQFWSHVSCVNRGLPEFESLAARMEQLFMETLQAGESIRYTSKEMGDEGVRHVQHSAAP